MALFLSSVMFSLFILIPFIYHTEKKRKYYLELLLPNGYKNVGVVNAGKTLIADTDNSANLSKIAYDLPLPPKGGWSIHKIEAGYVILVSA